MSLIDAWHHAALMFLNFEAGDNRTNVIYHLEYEDETILNNNDDYIFGNPAYVTKAASYLD